MSNINNELLKEDLLETIGEWASPELKDRLHEHNAYRKRMTVRELSDVIEEEFQRRSTVQRQEDDHNWRCGYDNLHEGALGDF